MVVKTKIEKGQGNFWIDEKVLSEFQAITLSRGLRQSWIVEELIKKWLGENRSK